MARVAQKKLVAERLLFGSGVPADLAGRRESVGHLELVALVSGIQTCSKPHQSWGVLRPRLQVS